MRRPKCSARYATRCARGGFERYEISNYALPGWECRHNINYWLRGDYFGFGCAAHSLVAGVRYAKSGFAG